MIDMPRHQRTRVLITGGAGFIGSHTVEALLARGIEVAVLDNLSAGKIANLPMSDSRLAFLEADVTDRRALESAMREATHCLHLAAQVSVVRSVEDPVNSARQNILGFVNALQAAQRFGVRRFVYASSAAVYGAPRQLPLPEDAPLAPLSPYGLEKQVNEQYARLFATMHGLASLGLRYFNVYGPRQDPSSPYAGVISKFVDRLVRCQPPTIYGDGKQTRDFVYVKDVARANVAALLGEKEGACNVATGSRIDLLGLLDSLARVVEVDASPEHAAERADDIRHSLGDATRLREWLGVQPRWTLTQGLKELVQTLTPV